MAKINNYTDFCFYLNFCDYMSVKPLLKADDNFYNHWSDLVITLKFRRKQVPAIEDVTCCAGERLKYKGEPSGAE